MAKETKQDRIVRTMIDPVTEQLHQLKTLIANPNLKEADLERWCEGVFRNCLGYTATNSYEIRAQESRGKSRPDLVILETDKPICVIEVKRLGFDLNKSDLRSGKLQLTEYLSLIGNVRWGILTNGYEWRLFDYSIATPGGVEVVSFDIRNEKDEIDVTKRAIEEVCWSFVDIHEKTYQDESWKEFAVEATAFSPDSLAKAILSLDTVKYISKVIRGEHDYKANVEVLLDKLNNLIVKGLDDSVSGWNETKEAELNKFVTSQKRTSRKKRTNKEKTDLTAAAPAQENTVDAQPILKTTTSNSSDNGSTSNAA